MELKKQSNEGILLHRLGGFSKNIVSNHHLENLSEFVLHDICSGDLFALPKAAFLVNNPDFACMKGVAGYHKPESFSSGNNWDLQKDFTSHMKQSDFNQKVRSVYDKSVKIDGSGSEKRKMHELADQFEIENPMFQIWDMKHQNQGLFIFEKPEEIDERHGHMVHFVPMLSFCSIF